MTRQCLLIPFVLFAVGSALCEQAVTGHNILPSQTNWISPDGRPCNLILNIAFSGASVEDACRHEGPYRCVPNPCGPSFTDHLLIRRLDVGDSAWQIIPGSALSEYPPDDSPCLYGSSSFTCSSDSGEINCRPNEQGDDCLPNVSIHGAKAWQGSVAMALPCGTWEVKHILAHSIWDHIFDGIDPGHTLVQVRQVLTTWQCGTSPGGYYGTEINIGAIADSEAVSSRVAIVHVEDCEEDPVELGITLEFRGYVTAQGLDSNWLPSAGDSIGLAYKIATQLPTNDTLILRHHISRISMWSGECMNYPWAAPLPAQTGFMGDTAHFGRDDFPHFDAWLCEPHDYKLYVMDIEDEVRQDLYQMRSEPDLPEDKTWKRSVAYIRADKRIHGPSASDTLWIKARDFGMYCEVTSEVIARGNKRAFVSDHVTAFGDTTMTITVPRDDDGFASFLSGFAHGDYMADYWEDSTGSLEEIKYALPFWYDTLARVDNDSLPDGRGNKGDSLSNWEEYRGFKVQRTLSAYEDSTIHIRTDRNRKTVFVRVHDLAREEVRDVFPAYVDSLPHLQVLYEKQVGNLSQRYSFDHTVDTNRVGGWALYPPHNRFLNNPLAIATKLASCFRSNLLVWWNPMPDDSGGGAWPDSLIGEVGGRPAYTFGYTGGKILFGSPGQGGSVPTHVRGIQTCIGTMNAYRADNAYYDYHQAEWAVDFPRLIGRNISHEFGHCIAMEHQLADSEGFMAIVQLTMPGRYPFPPDTFGTQSQSDISVSLRGTNP